MIEFPDLDLEFVSLDFEAVMFELKTFPELELPEFIPFDFESYT